MSQEFVRLEPRTGQSLRDQLFELGVEFPCGGVTRCGGCRVRVVEGNVPVTPDMTEALTDSEISAGWRLGCFARAVGPVTLEIGQWTASILDDRADVPFEPAEGYGVVVDVGTTTLVAQAVHRATGRVVAVSTALNPQARHGADLMSRIHYDRDNPGTLTSLLRAQLGTMVAEVAAKRPIRELLLVGNTAMHHLFAGRSLEPLAAVPFRSPWTGAENLDAAELDWTGVRLESPACFLPCIGGFVGSDILAGIIAVGLDDSTEPGALLDLGTNGEIAVGRRDGIRCASTAAGPAFEGGRVGQGMRAGTGAIDRVTRQDDALECHVLGGGTARGLCGSGLVDAVAAALDLGWIAPSGRLTEGRKTIPLTDSVRLVQSDIRELQLAKAALAAGFELLLDGRRLSAERVFLAGAFGNYIQAESAQRIGLLPTWASRPVAAGNSALRGARMLLLAGSRRGAILERALSRCQHVELASDPAFQDTFIAQMGFG